LIGFQPLHNCRHTLAQVNAQQNQPNTMDKRSKKRRRKQNKSELSFDLEMERLAAQYDLEVPDKNTRTTTTTTPTTTTEEDTYVTPDVDHEVLSRATQFIASSNWQVRSHNKFDTSMLRQPLRWTPPRQQETAAAQWKQGARGERGERGERGDQINQRDLVATCMHQIRDARECIFAIRSPTWCQSCVEGISNTFLSMQSFGNPLLAQNEDVVVNVRRLLSSCRGTDTLDPVTHVRILCDLDDMYHRCYYHMMSRKDDTYSKSKYPRPIDYLSTTAPRTKKQQVCRRFLEQEMQQEENATDVYTTAHEGFRTGMPGTKTGDVEKESDNPLLDALNLRWQETLLLFYDTGLARDGRMDAVDQESGGGSGSGGGGGNKESKKRKKQKKKRQHGGAGGNSKRSMKESSGPRLGRATWSPLCDPLLETWRHNCRDWLARLYAFAVGVFGWCGGRCGVVWVVGWLLGVLCF